jgi:hypothetical protein
MICSSHARGSGAPLPRLRSLLVAVLWLSGASLLPAATLSDPEIDAYNVRVGTQTFAGLYQFTTNTLLVETATAIRELGSDIIKFYLGPEYPRQYRITLPQNVTNLLTLARDEPSCRQVLDMPFRHFIVWVYPFASWWPFDGYSSTERAAEYREIYHLTHHLLTAYNNSGKTFYLGHWEGDGYFAPWTTNPPSAAIQGFIDCLNNRQKAIDEAKRDTVCSNVNVYCYAEVNRVRDAMVNGTNNNQRVINTVVPYVTNLDYLSYSSYDAQNLGSADLEATLDYARSKLSTNKAGVIPGVRIWVGEYGWGGSNTPDQQEPLSRGYIRSLLNWGCRFMLFWEIYNNETNQTYCLIDSNNVKVASYHLHQRFINQARLLAARFKERTGRAPTDAEFGLLVTPILNQPLPAPVSLAVSNLGAIMLSSSLAQVSGTFAQGVYGDDCATVWVFFGRQDGGSARGAWESSQAVAVNTNFNPANFTGTLTNLVSQTNYFFRFYATNSSGEAWAADSAQFSTATLNPTDFSCRLKVQFTGYNRGETLVNFPALVTLRTNLVGFDYGQFVSATGGDLRFTDASGLRLIPHEIDEWNTNGVSGVWVRVPLLSGTNDFIWAYWGNPTATNPPSWTTNGTVWSPDHHLVWHLKESGLPFADSARQHPALSGSAPSPTIGVVGRAGAYDGVTQFLDGGTINLGNAFTLSAWVKMDPAADNIQTVWANKNGGWNADGLALYVDTYLTRDETLLLETGNGAAGLTAATLTGVVTPGEWHRLTAVVDRAGGKANLFVDGRDQTQAGAIRTDFQNQSELSSGRFIDGNFYFKGAMDEVRIEAAARSSNWVWAGWMTAASNLAFSSYSQVNPRPALAVAPSSGGPRLIWPSSDGVFTLYSASSLAAPVTWVPATNPAALLDGHWQVALKDSGESSGGRFYQLRSP